jgi:hypothetical protein
MAAWLAALTEREASFLGSFVGPAVGLIALVLGALFNAHLNRRRDDRLRKEERRATAAALKAELVSMRKVLTENADVLGDTENAFLVPDLAESIRILPAMLPKMGVFDPITVQAVIEAYTVLEQYADRLLLIGGVVTENLPMRKKTLALAKGQARHVKAINHGFAETVTTAIDLLDAYLKD